MSDEQSSVKFLRLLAYNGEMTASQLGSLIWGREARNPQSYARPAGRVLARMQKQGLVTCRVREDGKLRLWQATRKAVEQFGEGQQ